MNYRQRLRLLMINMTAISLVVGGICIYWLNCLSLQQQKTRLTNIAQSQAQLLEAIAHTANHDPSLALNVVQQAKRNFRALAGTGEILIGTRQDNQILLLFRRYDSQTFPESIPWESMNAEPMRRALSGESGTITGIDHRGKKVLAAYEPIDHLNWGIVAKIDLNETQIPLFQAGLSILLITALLDALGVMIFRRVSQPIVKKLEQQETFERLIEDLKQERDREISERQRLDEVLRREIDLLARIMETSPVGIMVINPSGEIIIASDRAEQILGLSTEEIKQRTYNAPEWRITNTSGDIIPDELLPFQQVLRTRQSIYDLRHAIELPNGHRVLLSVNGAPLFNAVEELEGVVLTIEDISERMQVETALLHSEAQFRAIFEQAAVGISIITLTGQFIRLNQRYCDLLRYDEAELMPLNFSDILHPDDLEEYLAMTHQVWDTTLNTFSLEQRYLRQDGSAVWVNLSAAVVRNTTSEPFYLIGVIEDINERKQALEALCESEERYRRIIETTAEGVWILDADNKTTFVNERMSEMLGYTVPEMLGKSLFDFTDTQGRVIIEQLLNRPIGLSSQHDLKFLRSDGSEIWMMMSANSIYDTVDNYRGALGMFTDISERKRTEEALQQANEQLTAWVKELEQRNQDILLLNRISDFLQACLTVEEAYQVIGDLLGPLFPNCAGRLFVLNNTTNLVESVVTWGEESLSKTLFYFDECWALRRSQMHWVNRGQNNLFCQHIEHSPDLAESLCMPMMAQGNAVGLLYITSDQPGELSETKQRLARTVAEHLSLALVNLKLRESLQKQSIRDPLTGLYNQRYMEESLKREINHAKRKGHSVGLIMLDVDHFKKFNDTFGHDAGNLVLKEVSNFLVSRIRSGDIACRYGGEEFLLILPEASLENLLQRAEQIREGIKQLQPHYPGKVLHQITVSLGVASFPEHGQTGDIVLKAADLALYCAKAEGRDCVRVYSSEMGNRD